MPFAAATIGRDAYEDHVSSEPFGFDNAWAKVQEMWRQATTGQRIFVGAAGLFIIYLVFHAL